MNGRWYILGGLLVVLSPSIRTRLVVSSRLRRLQWSLLQLSYEWSLIGGTVASKIHGRLTLTSQLPRYRRQRGFHKWYLAGPGRGRRVKHTSNATFKWAIMYPKHTAPMLWLSATDRYVEPGHWRSSTATEAAAPATRTDGLQHRSR